MHIGYEWELADMNVYHERPSIVVTEVPIEVAIVETKFWRF